MRGNTDPSEDCEVSADVQQDENGEIQDDVDDLPYSMPKAAPEALMIATLAPLPTENQSRCAAIIDRAKEIASKHSRDLIGQNYDPVSERSGSIFSSKLTTELYRRSTGRDTASRSARQRASTTSAMEQ